MRRRRVDRKWTQTDLAREMKERGFPFHQQTIQRIEDGKRPVRLEEAYALAEILGSDVSFMSMTYEAFREREAYDVLWAGAVEMVSAVNKAIDEVFEKADGMRDHVEVEMGKEDAQMERVRAGIALLHRLVDTTDRVVGEVRAIVKEFDDAVEPYLPQNDDPDDLIPPSESEVRLRDFLKAHRASPKYKGMSIPELLSAYAPTLVRLRRDAGGTDG